MNQYGEGVLHRTDGPAVIKRDASTGAIIGEEWWFGEHLHSDGVIHRKDGPALTEYDPQTGTATGEVWRPRRVAAGDHGGVAAGAECSRYQR
jgi:hypothetical protein